MANITAIEVLRKEEQRLMGELEGVRSAIQQLGGNLQPKRAHRRRVDQPDSPKRGGPRNLSPEARQRIAEAQRRRWKDYRAQKQGAAA